MCRFFEGHPVQYRACIYNHCVKFFQKVIGATQEKEFFALVSDRHQDFNIRRHRLGERSATGRCCCCPPASGTVCPPNLRLCDPRLLLSDTYLFSSVYGASYTRQFDCVMRHRINCRERTTNFLVPVQLQLQSSDVFCIKICLGVQAVALSKPPPPKKNEKPQNQGKIMHLGCRNP